MSQKAKRCVICLQIVEESYAGSKYFLLRRVINKRKFTIKNIIKNLCPLKLTASDFSGIF
jgi:hypothetical protein